MSKVLGLQELVAQVPAGAVVAVGGFQLSRVPVALLRALPARNLSVICGPNPLALDLLADAGALRAADCGFIGLQHDEGFAVAPALKRAVASGTVALRQRDVYETIEELRAAARDGRALADFALLHAQRADRNGNLQIDDPYLDVLLAAAGGAVLATAEHIVEELTEPTIRAEHVAGVAQVQGGAAPAACLGFYGRDTDGVRAWLGAQASAPRRPEPAGSQPDDGDQADAEQHAAVDAYLINLARTVRDEEVLVTGLASAAAMLAIAVAQRTHAPRARYINCIGAVNPRIARAWPLSVEPALLQDCEERVDLADIFDLARDGGVDAMFFGAGQIDARGAINLERIGPADDPQVRLPGPAGSPSMRSWVRRVIVGVPRQSPRNLVAQVDAATSKASPRNRETVMVTDLAVWRLRDGTFAPESLAPGVDVERLSSATGFLFSVGAPGTTPPPTDVERAALQHIDRAGERFRLFGAVRSSRSPQQTEKVLHES